MIKRFCDRCEKELPNKKKKDWKLMGIKFGEADELNIIDSAVVSILDTRYSKVLLCNSCIIDLMKFLDGKS